MKFPARIEAKSSVMMGKPCVKGTRIPVYLLLEKMAAGETSEQLLAAYPSLPSRTCVRAWNTPRRWPLTKSFLLKREAPAG